MDIRELVPHPGEVYWAMYPRGEDEHRRIVVSSERFNRGDYVTVVPTTSTHFHRRSRLSSSVAFNKSAFGIFDKDCVAQAEQIATVGHVEIDYERGCLGTISTAKIRELIGAIGCVIDARCEPLQDS